MFYDHINRQNADLLEKTLRSEGLHGPDVIKSIIKDLDVSKTDEGNYFCSVCGRFSGSSAVEVTIDDRVIYSSPGQIVYCYRHNRPIGLCDDCYIAGRLDTFDVFEIEYFKEHFESNESEQCG